MTKIPNDNSGRIIEHLQAENAELRKKLETARTWLKKNNLNPYSGELLDFDTDTDITLLLFDFF